MQNLLWFMERNCLKLNVEFEIVCFVKLMRNFAGFIIKMTHRSQTYLHMYRTAWCPLFYPVLRYVFFPFSLEISGERATVGSVSVWQGGCSATTCSAQTYSAEQMRSLTQKKAAVVQHVSKSRVSSKSAFIFLLWWESLDGHQDKNMSYLITLLTILHFERHSIYKPLYIFNIFRLVPFGNWCEASPWIYVEHQWMWSVCL